MRIGTWNINSIRKRASHILRWIDENKIDILTVQETKVEDDKFPLDIFKKKGYSVIYRGEKHFNGVAVIYNSSINISNVEYLIDFFEDNEARFIYFEVDGVSVYSIYYPSGTDIESPRFQYKLKYFTAVLNMIKSRHTPKDKVLVVGDFNIAPFDIDVYNPKLMKDKLSFHQDEHKVLEDYFEWGFEDLYRVFHPTESDVFTWWDYRKMSFYRNHGLRIDLFLTTRALTDLATECQIDINPRRWESPSDHAPVYAIFNISSS